MRAIISASFLIALALAAVIVIASDDGNDRTVLKPKFVDWKKEDAGSDDMNLHLRVADALAKADGLSEKAPIPVPEQLLKEAQQAAEEQKSMPGVEDERMRKLHLPASLEKMFQQAKDEQEVEKLTKEGDQKLTNIDAEKKAKIKAAAQKKVAAARAAQADKARALKLLSQVSHVAKPIKKVAVAPQAVKTAQPVHKAVVAAKHVPAK
jgi:type III secretory pathway component EscV